MRHLACAAGTARDRATATTAAGDADGSAGVVVRPLAGADDDERPTSSSAADGGGDARGGSDRDELYPGHRPLTAPQRALLTVAAGLGKAVQVDISSTPC